MKLWLDEARPAPDASWTVCRTVREGKDLVRMTQIRNERMEAFSLDHDLSNAAVLELAPSGLDFVRWFIATHSRYDWQTADAAWEVHSQNPVGGGRMVYALWHAGYRVRWHPYGGFFGFIKFDRSIG